MTKELVLPFMSLLVIVIVLLLAILICVSINLAMTRKKDKEIMEMLRAINNKPIAVQASSVPAVSPAADFKYAPLSRSTVRSMGKAAFINQADTVKPQPVFTEREIELINVPDKTAAMLMAIVADELKTPIDELKFISIKEKA